MLVYPDDRILIGIINNSDDWQRVQDEHWYRIPVKHAPPEAPHFDWIGFYFTKTLGEDKWAIHYYAHVEGHELLTRRDLLPAQPDHKRANDWYYKFELGPLQHKLPPIVSERWRRISFIVTSGDRFEAAEEINDLFEQKSPAGQLYVTLKENGFHPERDWPVREGQTTYQVDLALQVGPSEWLPILFTSAGRTAPTTAICLEPTRPIDDCIAAIKKKLGESKRK